MQLGATLSLEPLLPVCTTWGAKQSSVFKIEEYEHCVSFQEYEHTVAEKSTDTVSLSVRQTVSTPGDKSESGNHSWLPATKITVRG